MNRTAILDALLTLLTVSGDFATSGRRLPFPSDITAQPAVYVRLIGSEYIKRPALGMPAPTLLFVEIWLYQQGPDDPTVTPFDRLEPLIQSVEASIKPLPGQEQTLGGLVQRCWLEGHADIDQGDVDGQAIAVLPVRIMVPY